MGNLRTKQAQEVYKKFVDNGGLGGGCKLCEKEVLSSFTYWKILENDFPYDKIADIHHMIVPIRHVTEPELSQDELNEFVQIKKDILHNKYEFIIEATHLKKSIPEHFHLHLIVAND